MAERIQLSRKKGWCKPPNTVVVARPSKFGNPFKVYRCTCCDAWDVKDENGVTYLIDHTYSGPKTNDEAAAKYYAASVAVRLFRDLYGIFGERDSTEVAAHLAGKNLACWCPLDQPCHADVLLELANPEAGT